MTFDTHIPPPEVKDRKRYPFRQMKAGESLWIPVESKNARIAVSVSAHRFSLRNPEFKFTTRQETREGVYGVRIWRIE